MTLKYSSQVVWSQEDGAFIASIPELPGCMGDGKTAAAALEAVYEVALQWIKTAKEMGREIPPPMTSDDYAATAKPSREKVKGRVLAS